ncbi:MAG: PD-(D/E)XK nuclease family protein [Bacteriovoracaceae bacterium]|jgi:hypothetical protein|nr:PD-(D/E)XK nuclease family protein [Bacteriovoracaceae bacterium]
MAKTPVVALYSTPHDFLSQCKKSQTGDLVFITPSPKKADHVRSLLMGHDLSESCEVLTINKFISNQMKENLGTTSPQSIKTKSSYMLVMAAVWKNMWGSGEYNQFVSAFKLFTDLRSFTIDHEFLSPIWEHYTEKMANSVRTFYQISQNLDLIDEQASYAKLAETLRAPAPEVETDSSGRQFVFWGFSHLGANQIDYIKAFSIRNNVLIPFPKRALHRAIMSDWISWFVDLSKVEDSAETSVQSINCAKFPKGMLSQTLRDFLTTCDEEQGVDLYLGAKKTQIEAFYEIPTKNLFSKGQVDLFEDEVEQVFGQLYQSIDSGNSNISKLKSLLKDSLQKTNFKYIKVVSIVHDILDEWVELSDDHDEISRFELDLFKEIAILDLPRNYFLPLSKDMSGEVFTVDDLIVRDASKTNILVVASHLSSIRSMQSDYPDKLEKSLCALGPIRRPEFDFCILKEEILDFIGEKNTVLLLEGGVADSSLDWNEILRNCSLEYFEIGSVKHAPRPWDVTAESIRLEKVSPTSLQLYLDCPRKYFLRYHKKLNSNISLASELQAFELGDLEHKVVQKYLTAFNKWDTTSFLKVVEEIINGFLCSNKKNVDQIYIDKYKREITNRSKLGIQFLLNLDSNTTFEFEKKLEHVFCDVEVYGRADCIIHLNEKSAVIDFKRSSSSIPAIGQFKKFEKVQGWVYPLLLSKTFKTIGTGYLNLEEPQKSLLFSEKEGGLEGWRPYSFGDELSKFEVFLNSTIEKMKSDTSFLPLPSSSAACKYCDFSPICSKGVDVDIS